MISPKVLRRNKYNFFGKCVSAFTLKASKFSKAHSYVDRNTLFKAFGPKDKVLKTLNCDMSYLVNTRDPENYTPG